VVSGRKGRRAPRILPGTLGTSLAAMPKATKLPRGRHNLSREEVAASQRRRMLDAIPRVVAEKGYTATSVADVLKLAGVSRETFYEHFANKEACFLAAYDQGIARLREGVEAAIAGDDDPRARFDRFLAAYLGALSTERALARCFLIEVYAAGPEAQQRRVDQQQRVVDAFAGVFGATTADERFACEALVAALISLVTARVSIGAYDDLPALREPLVALLDRLRP